jgi:glycosyltransferase involved in cell wall biosynthesis
MRICVDATALLLRSAGIKNYLYHWLRALAEHAPEHCISAFPLLGNIGTLDHDRSTLPAFQTYPRIAVLQFINKIFKPAINLAVPNAHIFHASNLVHAVPKNVRLTGTIHDMTCMLMPHLHTPANVRAESQYCERVFKRADGLIAVSHSAKNDAVRLLDLDPGKVQVIYHGIPESYFDASGGDLPMKFGVTKPYVLFVGTIEPRKNIDTLLDAWLQLPASTREAHDLVFVGPSGWAGDATVRRLHSGIQNVRVLGYVPEADLPSLTAAATAFAYPSLYEGFGFPIAQAMAAGVPVVTSNVSSMPEVAGDAGLTVDPRSAGELASALDRILTSPSLQKQLGSRGRESASKFTWKNSARQSAEFFTRVGT